MQRQASKEMKLLKSTGAPYEVLPADEGQSVARRFIDEFVSAGKREAFHLNLARAPGKQKPIDYHKYLHAHCLRDVGEVMEKQSLTSWMSREKAWHCYLLFSEPWIPPVKVDISSLRGASLSLFPDSYWVNFETKRLVVLTRDGDTILCDLAQSGSQRGVDRV
jgi:hypothetical protein